MHFQCFELNQFLYEIPVPPVLLLGERVKMTRSPRVVSLRERVLYRQPTGPNPLYHRDNKVDRPRAMGV